ncbi:DNA-binding transcriptional LysR family regulator [Neorhizobium sp. R1-B]|nr:DNA-binding transcriptional LysR family regulator [Neorhizobium sp. R1-B]
MQTYATEILALNEEAKNAIRASAGNDDQSLTIGTLETIATEKLAAFLPRFRFVHPDIGLTLKIGGSGDLQRWLEDGSIELAITFDRGQKDERFIDRKLSHEPMALIAGVNFRALPTVTFAGLSELPFIVTQEGCVYRHLFDKAFTEAAVAPPPIATQVDSVATIIRLVAAGTGYGLVPQLALNAYPTRGDLLELPWPGKTPTASLVMVWRRRRVQPPPLSLMLAAAQKELQSFRPAGAPLRHEG